jgi:hypothetical protein
LVAAAEEVDEEAQSAPDHPSIVALDARTAELEAFAAIRRGFLKV